MLPRSPTVLCLLTALVLSSLCALPAGAGKCPNLLIILDKSGSMADGPDNTFNPPPGGSKWDLAKAAIGKLLDSYDGQLPIGLSMFASDGGCGAGKLVVPPDYNSKMKINDAIKAVRPDSSTPTSETIDAMRNEKTFKDPSRSQYFLLITDGAPNCADSSPPTGTVAAISAAYKQVPSISTFVVGFGALPTTEANAMDAMAVAGGQPVMGKARKFYQADSLMSLTDAIEKILNIVTGSEVSSSCDDSCYAPDVGCPVPGDICIRAECHPNPCANVNCPPGLYCFTDGVTPGTCVPACKKKCPSGQRCEMGTCIKTDCPSPCVAGYVCNPGSHKCEPDPLCPPDPPRDKRCKKPSECQYGTCVDEPCSTFIKCPKNTRCVPWNGSCEFVGAPTAPPDMAPAPDKPDDNRGHGCSAGHAEGSTAVNGSLLSAAAVLLLLRRRRNAGSAQKVA